MLKFIEPFIEKKIQLAEYLYINRGELDTEFLKQELGLSSSTLKRYADEINELYNEYYYNGTYYNVYALTKIIREFLNQSPKLGLLKQIAFYPGNSADYYKENLLLSDSTFARLISQLKKELSYFNISIVISSGYWIEGPDEKEIVFLFAYIVSSFKTDQKEIYNTIADLGGASELSKLQNIDYSEFKFSNYPFETELFNNIHIFALMRQLQCKVRGTSHIREKITFNRMDEFLKSKYRENEEANRERFNHVVHTLLHDKVPIEKRERLIELLMKTAFHLQLFPYIMKVLDLRQDYFVRKMFYTYPHRKKVLDLFLSRMSHLLRVDLSKWEISIIYFLISENIFIFEKQEYFHLCVYSNLGEQHTQFLIEEMSLLKKFFNDAFIVRELDNPEELSKDDDIIILSNQVFENYPIDKQYIISDFLTMNEFLSFTLWLKERTVTKIDF